MRGWGIKARGGRRCSIPFLSRVSSHTLPGCSDRSSRAFLLADLRSEFPGFLCLCGCRLSSLFPVLSPISILISLRSNSSRRIAAYLLFCSPSLDSEVLVVLTRAAEGKTADILRQEFPFVNRQFRLVTDDLYA